MKTEDLQKFSGIMKAIAINSGIELTKDTMKFYFKMFQDYTIDEMEKAAKAVLATWEFNRMPPVAVFIKHLDGKHSDNALIIANKIIKIISRNIILVFSCCLNSIANIQRLNCFFQLFNIILT